MSETKYHQQATGAKAGSWVVCTAEQACRLGGEHITAAEATFRNTEIEAKDAALLEAEFNTPKMAERYNNVPEYEVLAVVDEVANMLEENSISPESLDFYTYEITVDGAPETYAFKQSGAKGEIAESYDGSSYKIYGYDVDVPGKQFDVAIFVTDDGRVIVQNAETDYHQVEFASNQPSLLSRIDDSVKLYDHYLTNSPKSWGKYETIEYAMDMLKQHPEEWATFKEVWETDPETYIPHKNRFYGVEETLEAD